MQKIILAPQEEIKNMEDIASTFFERVLDLNFDECLVTDESRLSDFSGCGLPDSIEADTLNALYDAWDEWIIGVVYEAYGLKLNTTSILLVDLFEEIENG